MKNEYYENSWIKKKKNETAAENYKFVVNLNIKYY